MQERAWPWAAVWTPGPLPGRGFRVTVCLPAAGLTRLDPGTARRRPGAGVFRFRVLLEAAGDIQVLGEAADGEQAVALARQLRPGVVLMDIQMPGAEGCTPPGRSPAAPTSAGYPSSVLSVVAAGLSNEEIAARPALSPATARTHDSRIITKVAARAQFVGLARESGLAQPGRP